LSEIILVTGLRRSLERKW